MTSRRLGHTASLCASLALLAACADTSEPLAPSLSHSPVPGEREVIICKDGNAAGTFGFSWELTLRSDGSPFASGVANVDVDGCVTVTTIPVPPVGTNTLLYLSVTEDAPPTDWALTSISHQYSRLTTPVFPTTIDLPSRTISGVGVSGDLGATVTFTNAFTPPPDFCTLTQGYWKNHSEDWDEAGENYVTTGDTFYNSGATYLEILGMSAAGGNAYLQLAHQFIAASLNVQGLSGSGVAEVDAALAGADAAFSAWAAGTTGPAKKSSTRDQWLDWAATLDAFNNGVTGPGHCDN